MAVVVDASAVGAMAFGEPDGETLAAYLRGETLWAPSLIDYELANLAATKVRRRSIPASAAQLLLASALRVPIRRFHVPGDELLLLAIATELTAYDAAYLWLASTHDVELVTLDRELAAAADALGGRRSK
jgi:predicted nucleic acid-binding protein